MNSPYLSIYEALERCDAPVNMEASAAIEFSLPSNKSPAGEMPQWAELFPAKDKMSLLCKGEKSKKTCLGEDVSYETINDICKYKHTLPNEAIFHIVRFSLCQRSDYLHIRSSNEVIIHIRRLHKLFIWYYKVPEDCWSIQKLKHHQKATEAFQYKHICSKFSS